MAPKSGMGFVDGRILEDSRYEGGVPMIVKDETYYFPPRFYIECKR
jgi:hypothetical protein